MPATFVPPCGRLNAPYVLVGEQPGRTEVRQREPFVGPSGDNLKECLHVAGMLWSECYRTNVVKDLDYPIGEYFHTIGKGKKARIDVLPMGQAYLDILREELQATSANVIIAMGNIALYALTTRLGITSWRGSVLDSTLLPGRKVIPTVNPASWTQEKLHKQPSLYLNKYLVAHDLKRAKDESMFPCIEREPHELIIKPSFDDALEYIDRCIQHGLQGAIIDYDIEILPYNQELSCIGISSTPQHCMCIPFVETGGDYFPVEQELQIMLELERLFSDERIRKRGQNVIFDSHYLLKKYGIRTHSLECTMVAQGILYPEMRKSLEFITAMWTDMPYYKSDGKIWREGGTTFERGWQYNCNDVISCAVAHPKQIKELVERGNIAAYNRQVKLIPPLTYMMEHGIRIDIEGMQRASEEVSREIETTCVEVSRLMHRDCIPNSDYEQTKKEFNLASSQQLCKYFYEEKYHKPYLSATTGNPTVDETALVRLANQGFREASLILRIREQLKLKTTYLDTSKIDDDGRMRCSYNPVGTRFGRISSSESIFGRGVNLQNQPHDVLTHFIADPGYVMYSLDMSQIENRIVAYVGNIVPMIQAFESGQDVHTVTAAMVLTILGHRRHYDEVTPKERQDFGKCPNHAFNYGFGYRAFSLKYEVPETDAKRIYEAYHASYPGLRNSYWALVQHYLRTTRILENLYGRKIQFLGMWSDKLLNEAYSAIPQSTCADHVNERGVEYVYYNEESDFYPVELLTQVHDSIEIQVPLNIPIAQHAHILCSIKESLETPLVYNDRTFVVPCDLVVNTCLNKKKGVELKGGKFSSDPIKLESELINALERLGLYETIESGVPQS